jgi:ParB family transcriptional regulator, chromosome partitioning protein
MSEELTPLRKNTKKGLGRGLGSLLGETVTAYDETGFERVETVKKVDAAPATEPTKAQAPTILDTERIWSVGIEKIIPNREQPRKQFEPTKLQELANSIKEKGILQPIVARKVADGKFEIIAGERRWRAAQLAGAHEVPVILKVTDNQDALELALIENIQRHDLNAIEESEAYQFLGARYGLTQQEIADKVGKDRSTVANLMRLSALSSEVKTLVKNGELQLGHAKALLAIVDPKEQTQLAKKAVQLNLSVRATEKMVAKIRGEGAEETDLKVDLAEAEGLSASDIATLTSELQGLLGTKVEIAGQGKRSKVSILFYSTPELNQFIEKLRRLRK